MRVGKKCPKCGCINNIGTKECEQCKLDISQVITRKHDSNENQHKSLDGHLETQASYEKYHKESNVVASNRVVVTDIDISFQSLVLFLTKAGLAAIPAILIVLLVLAIIDKIIHSIF